MKKIFIFLFLLLGILSSCGEKQSVIPSDILSDILMCYDKLPSGAYVYIDASEYTSDAYLSDERFSKIYFLDSDETAEYRAMMDSYAIYMSKNFELFEIHIIKSEYISEAEKIERMFLRRSVALKKSALYNYCGEEYRSIVNNIKILSKGKYVYMFITYDNAIAEAGIK
jgi:hypothetical protein